MVVKVVVEVVLGLNKTAAVVEMQDWLKLQTSSISIFIV